MPFEDTARDLFELFQLAWKVSDNCRQACGEKEPLTREVASVYAVVVQLQREADRPNSSLHSQDDVSRDEFEDTIYECRKALNVLNRALDQYILSRRKGGAKKAHFSLSVRYPNGEVLYKSDLLKTLSGYKDALQQNLRQLTPSSRGSVEWPLAKKYQGMQKKVDRMMADISSSHDGSSRSSSYSDDEKTVWKEVKKGLVRAGMPHRVIKKNRKAIRKYVRMLGWSETFDESPPPVHPSLNRYPEEVSPREVYTPEDYPRETFSQQNIPEQNPPQQTSPQPPFPHQNFPPQNFPPPPPHNFPPQNLPQNFPPPPPHNFPPPPPQNFPPPPPQNFPPQNFPQDSFHQQNFSQQSFPPPIFQQQLFPKPNFTHHIIPPPNFTRHILEQEIYPRENDSRGSDRPPSSRSNLSATPPPPQPQYIPPSVSDDHQEFDEKADFNPPEQTQSQFSARPYDLADNFQCSDKDTWNDMMESMITTLIDTSKNLYFPCSICNKTITTAPARLDRSQNWCRNCFHAIIYNVLYYPLAPPSWCGLRPVSEKRMRDIVTPTFKGLWTSSYEALRAMRGRPAGGMLVASLEEPPLLLYRNLVVKGEDEGRVVRTGYFEVAFFEEPFSEFVARRKGKQGV